MIKCFEMTQDMPQGRHAGRILVNAYLLTYVPTYSNLRILSTYLCSKTEENSVIKIENIEVSTYLGTICNLHT